jgi:hypothetical protein
VDHRLRAELLRRRDKDQAVARRLTGGDDADLFRRMEAMARENAEWLKQVINKHGWPGHSMVGEDGAQAAWLLVQHADHDAAFQRACLALITQAVASGEATSRDLGYLTDRVMLKDRGVQRYGTQFMLGPNGPEPQPLEDPDHVDELRASIGLETLSEYRAGFVARRIGTPRREAPDQADT